MLDRSGAALRMPAACESTLPRSARRKPPNDDRGAPWSKSCSAVSILFVSCSLCTSLVHTHSPFNALTRPLSAAAPSAFDAPEEFSFLCTSATSSDSPVATTTGGFCVTELLLPAGCCVSALLLKERRSLPKEPAVGLKAKIELVTQFSFSSHS